MCHAYYWYACMQTEMAETQLKCFYSNMDPMKGVNNLTLVMLATWYTTGYLHVHDYPCSHNSHMAWE